MTKSARKTRLPLCLGFGLMFAMSGMAPAQVLTERFKPIAETGFVSGPYQRYFRHILKISAHKYAVLFEPGFADAETARRAVAPLCAGKTARVEADAIPVDLVYEAGEAEILHGIRIHCG